MNANISTLTLTVIASDVLAANRFVNQAGTYPAAGGLPLGVSRTRAAPGDALAVDVHGTVTLDTAEALAVDDAIQVGTDGKAAKAAATGAACGRAMSVAAAGGQVDVLLIPAAK